MVSTFEPDKERENIREVIIQNYTVDYLLKKAFEQKGTFTKFYFISTKACIDGLKQQHIQDLKKEKFDVIIMSVFFDYCYFSFIHHFKVGFSMFVQNIPNKCKVFILNFRVVYLVGKYF